MARAVHEGLGERCASSGITRALPRYAEESFRTALASACAARAALGPSALVLFDASTLYFETAEGDGFREPGYSKERRLEPQITIGLLTDTSGFPLQLHAFEGNKAETKTMLPVIDQFLTDHPVGDVTVVADAGMLSRENRARLVDAGLSYIIGQKVPEMPYVVERWRQEHPGQPIEDGQIFTPRPGPGPPGLGGRHASTTSTGLRGHAAPCTASMSRSAKPRPSPPAEHRSNATGSSPSPTNTAK